MTYKVRIIDGVPVTFRIQVVHKIFLNYTDDYIVAIGDLLYQWEHSEKGQFVFSRAVEPPSWKKFNDINHFNITIAIVAEMSEKHWTEFYLKFDKISN